MATPLDSREVALSGLDYEDVRVEFDRASPVMKCGNEEREYCPLPQSLDDAADVIPEGLQEMENENIFSENDADTLLSEEESSIDAEEVDHESELEARSYQATLSQWSRGEVGGGIAKQVEAYFYCLVCIQCV